MFNVAANSLSLKTELYGTLQGREVYKFSLVNSFMQVDITNLGCAIINIYTPDKTGTLENIVAGFKDIKDYQHNRDYFGCIVGRYANRIAGARFNLKGENINLSVNDGENHLHGGLDGFNKKIWNIHSFIREKDRAGVTLEYISTDGEEGYPGNLHVTVQYFLNGQNQLHIVYNAETDQATPVNLCNHSYFNLTGFQSPLIHEHLLQINADSYTENNEQSIPTGNILAVSDTALDFSEPVKIGDHINDFPVDRGFNHNFILVKNNGQKLTLAAKLSDTETGRSLRVFTDQPAIQVYTANFWDATILGSQGKYYQKHGAVALETQAYPDSPNHPTFPNTILHPGEQYHSTNIYEFGVEQ